MVLRACHGDVLDTAEANAEDNLGVGALGNGPSRVVELRTENMEGR